MPPSPCTSSRPLEFFLDELGKHLARHLEARVDEHGWDAPATLWELHLADVGDDLPPQLRDLLGDEAALSEHPDAVVTAAVVGADAEAEARALADMVLAAEVHFVDEFHGHPFDGLVGRHATPEAAAVALSTEAWQYPDAVLDAAAAGLPLPDVPAGEHPDKVEIRMVHLVFRSGRTVTVRRRRDTGTVEVFGADDTGTDGIHAFRGRVIDALHRYLGIPSVTPVTVAARQAARQTWLSQTMWLAENPEVLAGFFARLGNPDSFTELLKQSPALAAVTVAVLDPASLVQGMASLAGLASLCRGRAASGRLASVAGDPATDPQPGSPDDLAAWDQARQALIEHLEWLPELIDREAAGSTHLGERAVTDLLADIDATVTFARWADAGLFATNHDIPDLHSSLARLAALLADGRLSDDAASLVCDVAGLDGDARAAVWVAAGPPGRNDPCPCRSGRKYKLCHGTGTGPGRAPFEGDAR